MPPCGSAGPLCVHHPAFVPLAAIYSPSSLSSHQMSSQAPVRRINPLVGCPFLRCTDPQEAGHRWRRHVHSAVPASSMAKLSSLKQVPAERPPCSALLHSESSLRNMCVCSFFHVLQAVLTSRLISAATKCVEYMLYRRFPPCSWTPSLLQLYLTIMSRRSGSTRSPSN